MVIGTKVSELGKIYPLIHPFTSPLYCPKIIFDDKKFGVISINTYAKLNKKEVIKISKTARGKRDGTGPYKGAYRTVGRRKAAGIKCPVKKK